MKNNCLQKFILTLSALVACSFSFGQNVAINTSGTAASSSAILDLSNVANMAFLPPQVALTNVTTLAPVPNPGPAGLVVYSTTAPTGGGGIGLYYWSGGQWNYLSTGTTGWGITGNAGINSAINYAGTTGAQDFVIRTTALERMRVTAAGGFGIGTTVPKSSEDINGNITVGTYAGVTAAPANGAIISGRVGIGTSNPNSSAILDLTNTTTNLGFLPPGMTTAQITAIAGPAVGLIVFNTTTLCLEFWDGGKWQIISCSCAAAPATPGAITGNASPCVSAIGIVYSIAAVAGATNYTWSVPAGATITTGQGTTSITVNFGTTSGNVSVFATNSCGQSGASLLVVTLGGAPATPGLITGATSIVLSSNGNPYSIVAVAGATSYTWTVSSPNATIASGQGTTAITVNVNGTTTTFAVCVTASNGCGTSLASCLTVTSSACVVLHGTSNFAYSGSLAQFTVGCGITSITITATGAAGGGSSNGYGARMSGAFAVGSGNLLDIIVGGQGAYLGYGGGGGGGSFVWNTTGNVLMIAAGGGGGGNVCGFAGSNASITNAAVPGGYAGSGAGGVGGNGGAGGGGTNGGAGYPATGGGGCGWLSNGAIGTEGTYLGGGGLDPLNGATGGAAAATFGAAGGYGGGGGAGGDCGAAGGGGGYDGGGGANIWSGSQWGGGGGAGSYNGGTGQTNTAGVGTANGSISITY